MKEVLILRDLECIKAIAHPRRIDILKAFNNAPLSAKQLSQMLDEPHAKINYHIKTLYKVGILDLVEEKIKSGIVEKYYYPMAKNILVDKNVINISLKEENEEKYISKIDDIIDLFYKAVKNQVLEEENINNYNDICLNNDELIELNNTIKYKIEELIEKRNKEEESKKYNIIIASIPV
ncbi:winged helix-turn-helix domain-containing protein [Romboutsia sp. 13368]|uniref:winged helix-turn-helix domain-containing protein n=1 Tax=Romboutsia sp. 13368 TaxID=2708053 RepID=UPI0025F029CE|nr:helix-turn-helix domain-containing protein [Romboutsia sp. 13368]